MKYLRITMAIVFSIVLFASCGSKKKQDQPEESFDLESYITAAEAIDPNLSKVDQIFSILEMVNAEYYDVLTNDPYNAHSYKSTFPIAAANLGIYVTDIIYHFYGEEDESMFLTFSAAQELAKYIGIDSEFATRTIESLEGNMVKRDSITQLFNGLMTDSEKYNSEQELVFVHTAFLTGSFVEKVYISSNLLKEKMAESELSKNQESDIRELLVIYLNQLDPSTGILYEAFEKQQDQLEGLIVLTTFQKLKELSAELKQVKSTLAVAPISEIASNTNLTTTFDLIANLRNLLVAASE
ncbi:MAG: hypothetical protein ABFS38_09865 [Bacteroidota bacterium]